MCEAGSNELWLSWEGSEDFTEHSLVTALLAALLAGHFPPYVSL